VTVAAGPEGRALFALSRPWLSAYAGRLDADLVVLDWCVDSHPIYSKFQLYRVIDAYPPGTRFAFIDADTAADPGACPDLFSLVPPGEFGVYDDLPGLRRLKANGVIREYQDFRAAVGLAPLPAVPWYGNTGVMVFGPEHRDVFAPPAGPIPRQHCGEQHWWTARLHDSGCKVRFLPPECNYQWWEHKSDPPPGVIRHFSGMRPHKSAAERLALMSLSAAGW
jgi:hypothetical protein